MRTIAIIAVLLFTQPALSQQKTVCPCVVGDICHCVDKCRCGKACRCKDCLLFKVELDMHDYRAACKTAIENNEVLLVGVGCEPPAGVYLTYRLSVAERKELYPGSKPAILVYVPDTKGWFVSSDWMKVTATVGELSAEAARLMKSLPLKLVTLPATYYQPVYPQTYYKSVYSKSC